MDGAKACRSEDGLIFVRLLGFFVLTAGKTASIFGDEKHANFLGFIFRAVVLTDGPTALAYPTNVDLFAGVPVRAVTS